MAALLMLGNEALARGAWESGVRVAAAYPGTPTPRSSPTWPLRGCLRRVVHQREGGLRGRFRGRHGRCPCADRDEERRCERGRRPPHHVRLYGRQRRARRLPGRRPRHGQRHDRAGRPLLRPHLSMPMLEPADSQECYEFVQLAYEISEALRRSRHGAHEHPDGPPEVGREGQGRRRQGRGARTAPPDRKTEKYCMLPRFSRPCIAACSSASSACARTPRRARWRASRRPAATARAAARRRFGPHRYRRRGRRLHERQRGGARARRSSSSASCIRCPSRRSPVRRRRRPALRRRGARALPRGADPRGRHRLRRQTLVPALGRAHAGPRRPGLPCRRSRSAALGRGEGRRGHRRHPAPAGAVHRLPHRGMATAMKKLDLDVHGDIGCYDLTSLPPVSHMHSAFEMGASIPMDHGLLGAPAAAPRARWR